MIGVPHEWRVEDYLPGLGFLVVWLGFFLGVGGVGVALVFFPACGCSFSPADLLVLSFREVS